MWQGLHITTNQLIKMKSYTITERTFNGTEFIRLTPVVIEAKSQVSALRQFFRVEKPIAIMGGDFDGSPLWADVKGKFTRRATITHS